MSRNDPEKALWFAENALVHQSDLRAWLKARFSCLRDPEDITQEAFSRLIKAYDSGPIANPRAYLFVVARNLALNEIRHSKYERPPSAIEVDPLSIVDEVRSPLDSATDKEDLRYLIEAIQSLPKRCRQVITLRKIYGLSQKETAKKLGISEHTVEKQSSIGLRKCIAYFISNGSLSP